jgi:plasmid stabilization system protein ParE
MTSRVTTTRVADSDIRDISTYIAADNRKAAERLGEELWHALERIGSAPHSGRAVRGFGVGLRVIRVSSRFRRYPIFYRLRDDAPIEVVRVLHGARDITALLAE